MLGTSLPGSIPGLHLNRIGVVPKGHTPGRWRLITDLSHPEGGSVNESEWCSLRYTTVEEVATAAQRLGTGALLFEAGPPSRRSPATRGRMGGRPLRRWGAAVWPPQDIHVLQWAMCRRGYLEDFITVGPPGSRECRDNLDRILAVLRWMMDLLRTPSATKPHHHIRLNHRTFRADLQWWETFAVHWNGVAMFPCVSEPTVSVTSGAWGCGAWSGSSCSRVWRRLLFGAGSGGGGGLVVRQPSSSAVTRRSCGHDAPRAMPIFS